MFSRYPEGSAYAFTDSPFSILESQLSIPFR